MADNLEAPIDDAQSVAEDLPDDPVSQRLAAEFERLHAAINDTVASQGAKLDELFRGLEAWKQKTEAHLAELERKQAEANPIPSASIPQPSNRPESEPLPPSLPAQSNPSESADGLPVRKMRRVI